jgi:ABC-type branched-subunit amino acid transport system substrate-binding protein
VNGNNRKTLAAAAALCLVAAAACSSSSSSKSTGSAAKTYTIGLLTDVTGLAASGNKTSTQGVNAGLKLASRDGYNFNVVVGDTTSSPAGAQAAAQKLVQQDHVFAVIAYGALTFGAANYLTSRNVPVIGGAIDGPEWVTAMNMFSVFGALHTNLVTSTPGQFFKMEGVNTVGALGYSISPSSSEAAKGAAKSSEAAGLKVGYLNANFPFGSTNVQPEALAMKTAGVDGFTATVDPNTAFALVTALRNLNVNLKVAVFPTGYGGDLLQAGPGALQEAQNVFFSIGYEPVEMQTSATQQFQSDLKAAGVAGEPTYAAYNGYLSVGLLIRGLNAAGSKPTQASLITALSGIHDWNSLGLWGGRTLDINNRTDVAAGPQNCGWYTKLVGNNFQLVSGADPLCGSVLPGVTVSPSS